MNEIVIYQDRRGNIDVRLEKETVWLRQEQMATLFGRDRTVIGRVFARQSKKMASATKAMCKFCTLLIQTNPYGFMTLTLSFPSAIEFNTSKASASVNGLQASSERTLTRGYTINRQRFEENAQELETALRLIKKTAQSPELSRYGARID